VPRHTIVRYSDDVRVFGLDGVIENFVIGIVNIAAVFIANLDVLDLEWLGVSIGGAFGAPRGCYGSIAYSRHPVRLDKRLQCVTLH